MWRYSVSSELNPNRCEHTCISFASYSASPSDFAVTVWIFVVRSLRLYCCFRKNKFYKKEPPKMSWLRWYRLTSPWVLPLSLLQLAENGDEMQIESSYITQHNTHFQSIKDRGNDLAKPISTPWRSEHQLLKYHLYGEKTWVSGRR